MRKILRALTITLFFSMLVSCSSFTFGDFTKSLFGEKLTNLTPEEKRQKKLASYNLEAKIKTNKGDINVYLYPEAAPETVANFVYLVKNDFYDNLPFHRVVNNLLIQSGDNIGDSTGGTGYTIKDEYVHWLTFDNPGILAMANTGLENSGSSQFFITLNAYPNFNNNYTVFGTLININDLNVAKTIRMGDTILDIEISGKNVNDFLNNFKEEVEKWDEVLKSK